MYCKYKCMQYNECLCVHLFIGLEHSMAYAVLLFLYREHFANQKETAEFGPYAKRKGSGDHDC